MQGKARPTPDGQLIEAKREVVTESNMDGDGEDKYGIIRGGQYAKRAIARKVEVSGPEFWKLDTDMQAAFTALEGSDGTVPSRGVYEIRAHRQRPWRVLARRIREARDAGVPKHRVIGVVRTLEMWIMDLYEKESDGRAA